MKRTMDVEAVNELLGDDMDASALVDDDRNICLITDGGGLIFAWRGPGVFEGHAFFGEEHRGQYAVKASKAALKVMHDVYDADMVWTVAPTDRHEVSLFSRLIGMETCGEMNTPEGDCELFVKRF